MFAKEVNKYRKTHICFHLQITKSINSEVEKTPVEQESSVADVTPVSGNSPWFLCNHIPVTQLFWPSVFQSSNPVQLQHTPFTSIAIPSNVHVPCSSESESCHKQNNLIHDNQTQNPLYMFPCPWLYPLPEFGNGQLPPSSGLKDKHDKLPLARQCSTSLSLNTMVNGDYQATSPIKLKTESSDSWTEARSINDPGHATPSFSLDGGEQKTGCHMTEKFHGSALGCNGHASAVKREPELQLHSTPNTKISVTASHNVTSSLEKKQEQFICPGKNLVDAAAAAEARKRRKELTKLKNIQNRQSQMEC